ncbi:MAG: hypothetical protein KDK90_27115 [Leptospiraceae bacterium]|nr:hypothetical protein [Leptospiraceae bacterium]
MPEVTVDATGKANMVIEITLPVSNAFQPNIQLAYNSNTQNGIFGIGWQMPSLRFISRDESAGVHYDFDDRFVSSLGGKLQKLTNGNYRNQVENESYNLFVPSETCGVGPCQWTVTDKNGTKYYFGYALTLCGMLQSIIYTSRK